MGLVWKLRSSALIFVIIFVNFFVLRLLYCSNRKIVIPSKCSTTFSHRQPQPISNCSIVDLKLFESMGSRDAKLMVSPKPKTIFSPSLTELMINNTVPFGIITISSTAHSMYQRNKIRKTWIKWLSSFKFRAVFIVGVHQGHPQCEKIKSKLQKEHLKFGDLVVIDFEEGYYRLTAKTLKTFQWFLSVYKDQWNRPKFFIKTDHDVFINIPLLHAHLMSEDTRNRVTGIGYYFGGHVMEGYEPHTNQKSKWYACPEYWLPGRHSYPDFLSGPFYILSENIVEPLFKASFEIPLFPFEDVYITGILRETLKMTLSNIQGLDLVTIPELVGLHYNVAAHPIDWLKIKVENDSMSWT